LEKKASKREPLEGQENTKEEQDSPEMSDPQIDLLSKSPIRRFQGFAIGERSIRTRASGGQENIKEEQNSPEMNADKQGTPKIHSKENPKNSKE
jgi:hypothetical protein